MGKGNPNPVPPPMETRWKKGQSGNPGGKTLVPTDVAKARAISQFEFERIVNKYLFLTPAEMQEDLEKAGANNFELLIGRIVFSAVATGDEKKAEWILARTLGKMRERLEVESKSLKVSINATQALPTLEQLALENPDLSQAQLESFADKLTRLREEIAASKKFGQETLAIQAIPLNPEEGD